MAEKAAKPIAPPKKKMMRGTALSSLIGILSLALGAYLLTENFGIFKLGFKIPSLIAPIMLILAGLFLLKEAAQRSTLTRLKSVYEKYI